MKKTVAYILVGLVLIFTVLSILGIWDVIDLDYIMKKILLSLVIFAASAVILFIFTILAKEEQPPK